ncbi:helix-turn-helix domain-containing protein [Motiliproteus sp. MSK22-1]|uniref:helix-turn-helix domain-containing protein n=1 Tax=Motiliproteus sp. MSK22-1 TaxID=1897630 RepID=UPI000975582A|nr:helix-turn-helix domain-containing protein [Motiliproteus sp. MSK22-1]OMH25264.1 hypothetical protein BGP75_26050 [Motiliproteus sp. MSK22-1]
MSILNSTFCRRLIILDLIDTDSRPSVPQLIATTGWPRRTVQDIIKALPGLGVKIHFHQDGKRNNDGYYIVDSWGPIDRQWVKANRSDIDKALEPMESNTLTPP